MKLDKKCELNGYISSNGPSLCINIPKPDCQALGLKVGSLVKIKLEVRKR